MNEPVRVIDEPGHGVAVDDSPAETTRWRGRGFGLSLSSTYPVHGVNGQRSGVDDTPTVSLSLTGSAPRWPAEDNGQRVREIRFPDGALAMVIEDHGSGGFRIADAQLGAHSISVDGSQVHSSPAVGLEPWRWQRLLIGQVLPLVATINGLETLHASAISAPGQAFAIAGDSGAGKSTVAAHLVLRGYDLLTDDVLSVSLNRNGQPVAHPGSAAMSFRGTAASLAQRLRRGGVASAVGQDEKAHVLLAPSSAPLPLKAIFWLRRASGPIVETHANASVMDLLKLSYVRYLRTPQRLTRRLEVQAAIANNVALIPVNIADTIAPEHLSEELDAQITSIATL